MTIEELKQAYEPEGVYAGMTQAEALRYLAKRYLRKPECVALCNEVANNLPKLLKVAEAADYLHRVRASLEDAQSDPEGRLAACHSGGWKDLTKALEELK